MKLDPSLARDRMVITAARWLPQRGMAGLNMVEVARAAQAPRGSVYHYFPGGRDQLLAEAIELASYTGRRLIERTAASAGTPAEFVEGLFAAGGTWIDPATQSGGCPIAAAMFSAEVESLDLQQRLRGAMQAWRTAIHAAYIGLGMPETAAAELAPSTLMAFHGAMLLAKADPAAGAFAAACRMVQAALLTKTVSLARRAR
ncbi:MAG: hypothetical protein RJA98_4142 [Pseudomonadota bacterium]|jgi:AcrR family transcriptional regulator